jgi:VIT1/CCC1 family predicted Fe2+/Mn2+ transporter
VADAKILDEKATSSLLAVQRAEITEHFIYRKLSESTKDPHNRDILKHISNEELGHHNIWKGYTHTEAKPNRLKIWIYYLISKILGVTFGIKLMELGEVKAQRLYQKISQAVPAAGDIAKDEEEHERELIGLIDEERLKYTGDMVRGLNVALVELTGVVAGLTLALPERNIIIAAGLITGFIMTLSLAGTEYLATRTAGGIRNPLKSVAYAGLTNILTALFLLFPYLILVNIYLSLGIMILNAVIVILAFSFYISVAKEISFRKRFTEMSLISLGIAGLAFGIGFLARIFLHIHI